MRVTISVGGRFHAFNLAHQLLKRGHLRCLITSYPKFEVRKYGIPRSKVKSLLVKELLERGWRRLPTALQGAYNPQYLIHEAFDRLACRRLEPSDITVGWSSFFLRTMRVAKQMGAVTIVERGSSHMLYQQEILREEYGQLGLMPTLAHPRIVEKELEEYEQADYIAVPSHFVKRTFLERGTPEEKLIYVPFGVDLDEFGQVPKDDDRFRVVYAGGMTIRKGVHFLLQAFCELNLPNAELFLVGAMREEMQHFFKRYEDRFTWIGHVPQRELHKYYSQGSVFVLASLEEGLAMVLPQAMACGLPVICTENTGGSDIIRDGVDGFIIPIRETEAIKEKLLFLYDNPDLCRKMGRSAQERVATGFTWDDYGERIVRAYEKILLRL
jgi:glycosyltransferase involved in cell wall biosynthesis